MKNKGMKLGLLTALVGAGLVYQSEQVFAKSYEEKQTFAADQVKQIEIKNESWNIEISESTSNEIKVALEGKQPNKKQVPVTLKQQKDQLLIEQKEQSKGMFSSFSFGAKGTISITVPKGKVDEWTIQNKDGDLTVRSLTATKILIENQSGTEEITGLSADTGSFESEDGDISIKDSNLEQLQLTTTSGEMNLDGVVSDELKMTSKDGEMIVRNAVEGKKLSMESTTGDISVAYKKVPTSLKVSADTESKDITINLQKFKPTKETSVKKTGQLGQGENDLLIKSKKGMISIK